MTAAPKPRPLVISIQSQVAYGHVGNSAAAMPMRALGIEVVEVPTALLSNHPHYPTMRGRILEADLVADLLLGLEERGLPDRATAILSGFMGRAETAEAVTRFVTRARRRNPELLFACDPVMGDADIGFFAAAELQRAFATQLVPLADVIFPNAFELSALAGQLINAAQDVSEARDRLGVPAVVATSVPLTGKPDALASVVADRGGLTIAEAPRLPVRPAGTGDLFAALTLAWRLRGRTLAQAAQRAVAGLSHVLNRTDPSPWAEMPIAAELDRIVNARWAAQ